MKNTMLVIAMFGISTTATAAVYRCTEGGKVVYADRPCVTAGTGDKITVRPGNGGVPVDIQEVRKKGAEVDAKIAARRKIDDDEAAQRAADRAKEEDRAREHQLALERDRAFAAQLGAQQRYNNYVAPPRQPIVIQLAPAPVQRK